MKLTIAAIVLTFALFANAHVVVDIAHHHSHVGEHGPALVNSQHGHHAGWGNDGNGDWGHGHHDNGQGGDAYHGYSVGYPHGGAHITLHTTGNLEHHGGDAGHGHGHHDGKYVAANRGAVHVAPLVGHIQSVKSTNEQPAPGTNTSRIYTGILLSTSVIYSSSKNAAIVFLNIKHFILSETYSVQTSHKFLSTQAA